MAENKDIEYKQELEKLENERTLLKKQEAFINNFLSLLRKKYLENKKIKEKDKRILKDKRKILSMQIKEVKQKISQKSSDVKHVFDFYSIKFKELYGAYPMIDYAIEGNLIKKILSVYNMKQVEFFVQEYLLLKDSFIKESGYRLRFLPSVINKLLTKYYKMNEIESDVKKLKLKEIERLSNKTNDKA